MLYGSLVRKRTGIIGEIKTLRAKHRRRKPLSKILQSLTLQQLRMEIRLQEKRNG